MFCARLRYVPRGGQTGVVILPGAGVRGRAAPAWGHIILQSDESQLSSVWSERQTGVVRDPAEVPGSSVARRAASLVRVLISNGGVGYSNCPNARLCAGAQPPNPFSSSMRLKRAPLTTSTLQRTDPASDGRNLETCLVALLPSGGTERYPDPAMIC